MKFYFWMQAAHLILACIPLCLISADTHVQQANGAHRIDRVVTRNVYFPKVDELLSQIPDLQLQVQYIKQELKKLKESTPDSRMCASNDESHSGRCNESLMKELENAVQNLRDTFEQGAHQSEIRFDDLAGSCQATGIKLNENADDLMTLNLTVKKISQDIENLRNCLENECAISGRKSIKPPSFISSWFRMRVNDPVLSKVVIEHGLNELPAKVDVQIKSISEADNDWIFTAATVIQGDDDTGEEYGGVVYFYNESIVILSVPTKSNNYGQYGFVVTTGHRNNFFINSHHYKYTEGFVRVKIWLESDFPIPAYTSQWLPLDVSDQTKSFQILRHGLNSYPALVVVQIRDDDLVSEGMGSVMTPRRYYANGGGVLYGYDDKTVRIWSAFMGQLSEAVATGYGKIFGGADGWSYGPRQNVTGEYRVKVWAKESFSIENFYTRESNSMETEIGSLSVPIIDLDNDLVSLFVQALDGPNSGFRYKGWGSSQATSKPFGGAIYAYNKQGKFQVWKPNPGEGYLVHISSPYGDGDNTQASNRASYVVNVLATKK